MKKNHIKLFYLFLFTTVIYFFCDLSIVDASNSTSIVGPDILKRNQTVTYSIYISTDRSLYGVNALLSYDTDVFDFVEFRNGNGWSGESNVSLNPINLVVFRASGGVGNQLIGTVTLRVKSDALVLKTQLSLNQVEATIATNSNMDETVSLGKAEIWSQVVSNENALSQLSLSSGILSPFFEENKTYYTVKVANHVSSVSLNAVLKDATSHFVDGFGPRTISLNYGGNTAYIKVQSAEGTVRTYTININREDGRSSNNYLQSLSSSVGSISFHKDTMNYRLTVPKNTDTLFLQASLSDAKANFLSGYGPRNVNLKFGLNTFYMKVRAENGAERTYTIDIIREDGRSHNYHLSSLVLSSGVLDFKKDVLDYTVYVANTVDEITIEAKPEDSKAKVSFENPSKLVVGETIVPITVTSEIGESIIYTIKIVRKEKSEHLSNDNTLKSITVNQEVISVVSDKYLYYVKVKKGTKLNITAITNDPAASVRVLGNENVKDGSEIYLVVTAEDSTNKKYCLVVSYIEEKQQGVNFFFVLELCLLFLLGGLNIRQIQKRKAIKR